MPSFNVEIVFDDLAHKLVPVDLADEGARIVAVGNISGILGEQIAYDLSDRVVALFTERFVDLFENGFVFLRRDRGRIFFCRS